MWAFLYLLCAFNLNGFSFFLSPIEAVCRYGCCHVCVGRRRRVRRRIDGRPDRFSYCLSGGSEGLLTVNIEFRIKINKTFYYNRLNSVGPPWANGLRHCFRSFAYDHVTVQGSSPACSHGAHRQATPVVEGSFGHGPQHPCLQCLGQLSPLHEQSTGVVNEWLPSFGGDEQEGDKRHRHNAGLQKSGGHKNRSLPYDLWRL